MTPAPAQAAPQTKTVLIPRLKLDGKSGDPNPVTLSRPPWESDGMPPT